MVEHVHRPPLPRQDRPQARQLLPWQGKYDHDVIYHGMIDVAAYNIQHAIFNYRSIGQTCYEERITR